MSLGAAGQLGKALVFFAWKGLNCVREYVIPSNPKTSGQTTQRGYLTSAVAAIHAAQAAAAHALVSVDVSAYALWATVVKSATTWFNQAVKNWVDLLVAGDIPCVYSDFSIPSTSVGAITINLYLNEETGSSLADGKFYFGTSKTALLHTEAADVAAGDHVEISAKDLSAFLTAGVKYFVQFRPDIGDDCEGAYSGIYHFVAT